MVKRGGGGGIDKRSLELEAMEASAMNKGTKLKTCIVRIPPSEWAQFS
jgi:hypothetical protein